MPDKFNIRNQLLQLGVGDFNATMSIPYMLVAPRTSDPAMIQIIIVVRKIQEALQSMGARVEVSGVLDDNTARAMQQICGPEWLSMPYYEIVRCVLNAKKARHRFIDNPSVGGQQATGDWLDTASSVAPYAIGALILYKFVFSREARSNRIHRRNNRAIKRAMTALRRRK